MAGSDKVNHNAVGATRGLQADPSAAPDNDARHHLYGLSPVIIVKDPAATDLPPAPSYPFVTVHVKSAAEHRITWRMPVGSEPAFAWKVQWSGKPKAGVATSWNDLGTFGPAGATHTAERNNKAYFYRVKSIGFGGESEWGAIEPTRPPDRPTGLRAVAKDGMFTLYWDDPNDPGMADGGDYEFAVGRSDWTMLPWRLPGSYTSATIDVDPSRRTPTSDMFPPDFDWNQPDWEVIESLYGFKNGKEVRIHLRARNSRGVGPRATVTVTPNTDDKTPAYVKKVEIDSRPASGDTYGAGEIVQATVTFSRPVTVDAGTGAVRLWLGPDFILFDISSEELSGGWEDTTRLVMDAEVGSQTSGNPRSIPQGFSIPRNCIRLTGNASIKYTDGAEQKDAILDCPETGPDPNQRADATKYSAPVVRDIAIVSDPGPAYEAGDKIIVRVTMSHTHPELSASPAPGLTIRVGAADRQAKCALNGDFRSVVDCTYVVAANELDADGVSVASNALSLPDGAYWRDSRTDATLLHPALPDDPFQKVNARLVPLDPRSAREISLDWEYVPDGFKPGQTFRLLFITSTTRNATSIDVDDYDRVVQLAAYASQPLRLINQYFQPIVSPPGSSAVDQAYIDEDDRSTPIYWVGGEKVADHGGDFLDGSWDSHAGKNERGEDHTPANIWTGSTSDGDAHEDAMGSSLVRAGKLETGKELSESSINSALAYPLYALSGPIKVRDWPKPALTVTGSGHGKATLTWESTHQRYITSWYYTIAPVTIDGQSKTTGAKTAHKIEGSGARTRSHTVTGLEIGKNYRFRVYPAACCEGDDNDEEFFPGDDRHSNEVEFKAWKLPAPPTDVKAVRQDDTTVVLTWTRPAITLQKGNRAAVTGYQVEYSTDARDGGVCCGTWHVAGRVDGADTLTFTHTHPEPPDGERRPDYVYVVKSTSYAGNSVSSRPEDEYYPP